MASKLTTVMTRVTPGPGNAGGGGGRGGRGGGFGAPANVIVGGEGTGDLAVGGGSIKASALQVDGTGEPADWWRVVAVAAWRHLDEMGESAGSDGIEPPE